MFTIETKLRHLFYDGENLKQEDFFSIDDSVQFDKNIGWFDGSPLMYIPGYIEIAYYGQVITNFNDWDYPLYMWQEIFNSIDGLINGKGIEINFLEEPKKYIIDKIDSNSFLLYIEINGNAKSKTVIPRIEVVEEFLKKGIILFDIVGKQDFSFEEKSKVFNMLLENLKSGESKEN